MAAMSVPVHPVMLPTHHIVARSSSRSHRAHAAPSPRGDRSSRQCARTAPPRQRRGSMRCRASGDDAVTLSDLRAQLEDAVRAEDYTTAASLRDTLQKKESDGVLAVQDANRRFYAAFNAGSLQVMESWAAILRGVRPGAFKILVEDVRVFAGDASGFVTCVEVVDADDSQGRTIATNVFEKQGGRWVITHHHGSPLMRMR